VEGLFEAARVIKANLVPNMGYSAWHSMGEPGTTVYVSGKEFFKFIYLYDALQGPQTHDMS
jgi:hypothetical protein